MKTSLRSHEEIGRFAAKSVCLTPCKNLAFLKGINREFCSQKCIFDPMWRCCFAWEEKQGVLQPKVYVWPCVETLLCSRLKVGSFAAKSVCLTPFEDLNQGNREFCSQKLCLTLWRDLASLAWRKGVLQPKVYVWPRVKTSLRSHGEVGSFAAKSVCLIPCKALAPLVRRIIEFCTQRKKIIYQNVLATDTEFLSFPFLTGTL